MSAEDGRSRPSTRAAPDPQAPAKGTASVPLTPAERAKRYRERQRDADRHAERHAEPAAAAAVTPVTRTVTTVGTTKAERDDLQKVARMRAKVARDTVAVREAELLADVEQQLSEIYRSNDEAWEGSTERIQAVIDEENRRVREVLDARGVPRSFQPQHGRYWAGRGENAFPQRRAELRLRAQTRIAANGKAAKLAINTAEAQVLTEIIAGGLTSDVARAFLESIPTPEQLMPPLSVAELEAGR